MAKFAGMVQGVGRPDHEKKGVPFWPKIPFPSFNGKRT